MNELKIVNLGHTKYQEALDLQKKLQADLIAEKISDRLILCSHPAVITYSKEKSLENLLADLKDLNDRTIDIVKIGRGGDITYHDQSQAILYPIINLKNHKTDVDWYLRKLEDVVLATLDDFGIVGSKFAGKTGIWIDSKTKIASIGVRLSRWCSMHGLALNVLPSSGFSLINPCGFDDIKMTSIQEELDKSALKTSKDINIELALERLSANFCEIFGYSDFNCSE